jgi:regulatory protein
MLITTIIRKRTKRPLYAIYVDGAYAFDVSDEVLVKFGLGVGEPLDEKKVEQIVTSEALHRALQIAINFISYRPRSSREVIDHLKKKSFSEDLARTVAQQLQKKNLVDDVAFAKMFVRDRLKRKPMGSALLRQQLLMKGIPPNVIQRVLHDLVSEDDQQRAAEVLAAKRLSHAGGSLARLDPTKRKRRLFEYLLRRGFSTDIATKTVRTLFAHHTEGRAA